MGILGLSPFLKKSSTRSDLFSLKNGVAGIDLSIWLHHAISLDLSAAQCSSSPPLPVDAISSILFSLIGHLRAHNITPCFVFDGAKHPLKAAEDARRGKIRTNASVLLAALVSSPSINDRADFSKLQRSLAQVDVSVMATALDFLKNREGVILIGGPFEADW